MSHDTVLGRQKFEPHLLMARAVDVDETAVV